MQFISLFAGIGGFDLGLERAGMECVAQVEIDEFCQKVLKKHWPDVPRYGDIRNVNKENLPAADLICGGFPCQDISYAGKQAGIKKGTRSGLWIEFYRLIRELRPRYVVVENVSALLVWELGTVLGDLASSGFNAEWQMLPAAAFGAPHIRDRCFIFADSGSIRRDAGRAKQSLQGTLESSETRAKKINDTLGKYGYIGDRKHWIRPTIINGMDDGIPGKLDKDRIKSLGNAVVPQVAEFIGRAIMSTEQETGIKVEETSDLGPMFEGLD